VALPKENRLKSRHDFRAVFRLGTRCHGSLLTLRALKPLATSEDNVIPLQSVQIGITISTKVSKRAVVRNRLKRRIAAALYQLLPKLSPGWRLVVIVQPTAGQLECVTKQFLQELEQLLAQAEVLNGHSGRSLL